MAGVAFAAFEDFNAGVDALAGELVFAGPASADVREAIAIAMGRAPDAGLEALNFEGLFRAVFEERGFADDAFGRIDLIGEGDEDVVFDVFEGDFQGVGVDGVRGVVEDQVADAVGARDLDGRFVVTGASPAEEFLVDEGLGGVEGGKLAAAGSGGDVVGAPEGRSPVEVLEFAAGIDAEGEGARLGAEEEEFFGCGEFDGRLGGEGRGQGRASRRRMGRIRVIVYRLEPEGSDSLIAEGFGAGWASWPQTIERVQAIVLCER
jgi:hypothetical protein